MEREQAIQFQREMEALATLTQIRRQIEQKHGVYQGDLLAEIRAEREQELNRLANGTKQAGAAWVHWIGESEQTP